MIPYPHSRSLLVCLLIILVVTTATPSGGEETPYSGPFMIQDDPPWQNQDGEPMAQNTPDFTTQKPPQERISEPDRENSPTPQNTPDFTIQKPPQEWISGPEDDNALRTGPDFTTGIQEPKERISGPQGGSFAPAPFTEPSPAICPAPVIPRQDPPPVIRVDQPDRHPVRSIYPVYPDYRYVSSSWYQDRSSSCSYDSYQWYQPGTLEIRSSPGRAEVWLDERFRGKTPHSGYLEVTDLSPGTYDLEVRSSGFIPYIRTITIGRGEVESLNVYLTRVIEPRYYEGYPDRCDTRQTTPVQTPSPVCGVTLSSEPAGASVLLNNEYRGITPVTLKNLDPGEYTLILSKGGYHDFITRVTTVRGETLPFTAYLTPLPPTPAPTPAGTQAPVQTRAPLPSGIVMLSLLAAAGILCHRRR